MNERKAKMTLNIVESDKYKTMSQYMTRAELIQRNEELEKKLELIQAALEGVNEEPRINPDTIVEELVGNVTAGDVPCIEKVFKANSKTTAFFVGSHDGRVIFASILLKRFFKKG